MTFKHIYYFHFFNQINHRITWKFVIIRIDRRMSSCKIIIFCDILKIIYIQTKKYISTYFSCPKSLFEKLESHHISVSSTITTICRLYHQFVLVFSFTAFTFFSLGFIYFTRCFWKEAINYEKNNYSVFLALNKIQFANTERNSQIFTVCCLAEEKEL